MKRVVWYTFPGGMFAIKEVNNWSSAAWGVNFVGEYKIQKHWL